MSAYLDACMHACMDACFHAYIVCTCVYIVCNPNIDFSKVHELFIKRRVVVSPVSYVSLALSKTVEEMYENVHQVSQTFVRQTVWRADCPKRDCVCSPHRNGAIFLIHMASLVLL